MSGLWLPLPEQLPDSLTALREAAGQPDHPHHESPESVSDPRHADYDVYFGVVRASRAPAHTLVRALRSTAAEAGWTAPATEPALRAVLTACGLTGHRPACAEGPSADPLVRWKAGHRLFFALIQTVVVALRDATAGRAPESHPAPTGTRTAAILLRACADAMHHTASFTPDVYDTVVRPSMEPPAHRTEGFSGLWSADHQALVRQLRTWGTVHARACGHDCPPHQALSAALNEVHTAHRGICARFVGHGPSLLGGADALSVLDRLRGTRRRLLRHTI